MPLPPRGYVGPANWSAIGLYTPDSAGLSLLSAGSPTAFQPQQCSLAFNATNGGASGSGLTYWAPLCQVERAGSSGGAKAGCCGFASPLAAGRGVVSANASGTFCPGSPTFTAPVLGPYAPNPSLGTQAVRLAERARTVPAQHLHGACARSVCSALASSMSGADCQLLSLLGRSEHTYHGSSGCRASRATVARTFSLLLPLRAADIQRR